MMKKELLLQTNFNNGKAAILSVKLASGAEVLILTLTGQWRDEDNEWTGKISSRSWKISDPLLAELFISSICEEDELWKLTASLDGYQDKAGMTRATRIK